MKNVENREVKYGKDTISHEQVQPQNRKLILNVGGFSDYIYEGSSIKVKCPVKEFNKQRIYWTKNGERIMNSGECDRSITLNVINHPEMIPVHIKVSVNGALRIFHSR